MLSLNACSIRFNSFHKEYGNNYYVMYLFIAYRHQTSRLEIKQCLRN